ncbi:hypothetical protein [Mangrovihabitans endophyticus]|uniref:Heavy-metal chelation domain-containing protein n=1 Tax=Mangrovihabitans endophyticus TaxID=1751298 RepID=A0A8J3BTP8_9ACTN|nr:hypothetical protein [Mangrovihabitans endophyticus]GGK73683.1 hypothetical protein GCM10012284_04470 [Mangrovihabitans endophyticus]
MSLIDSIWSTAEGLLSDEESQELVITGAWRTVLWLRPSRREITFKAEYLVITIEYQGCSFVAQDILDKDLQWLVGKHYSVARQASLPVRIAVADALCAHPSRSITPDAEELLDGSPEEKALWRARIVARETAAALRSAQPISNRDDGSVALVGVSALIADELLHLSRRVEAFDLYRPLVNSRLRNGILIRHGSKLLESLHTFSAVVVTGMALSTNTLQQILINAGAARVPVVVYAQTGANIAPWYVRWGAQTVIAEPLPFYNFQGLSSIRIYRRAGPPTR